ncbi:MAG: ABC transporter ATP-binding protein [Planctomycetes bacterium]|nr:ABC transporter ATP-binding protein [Planctomycetota bacterium]
MPVITVDNLVKRFAGRAVLAGVSLRVEPGETVAVLGRSGTGKSVLLKSIIGLMDPDEGRVTILDRDLHAMSEAERLHARKDIGYVFQGAALFDSLTVQENVGFALYQLRVPEEEIREKVRERLRMVGLEHAIDQYPSELSGGMQKRVGLARAIINLPKVVLYDEPTTGLDPVTTDVINQIILRLRAKLGVTSVVVTHDVKSAFTISDRIIMLDQGRIVAEGTPEQIQASDNTWVQHFIHGRALESERVDTKLLPVVPRVSVRVRRAAAADNAPIAGAERRDTPSAAMPIPTLTPTPLASPEVVEPDDFTPNDESPAG